MRILALIATLALPVAGASAQTLRVTFLGTAGGPVGAVNQAGPSTLVEYGSEVLLIDAGRGVVQRLQQLQKSPADLTRVFLTHLHSDHTFGLPEVWLSGWWRGRTAPLEVRGPAGTRAMVKNMRRAWDYDVAIRTGPPENLSRETAAIVGIDTREGVVYERNGVRVTAIRVDHGPVLCYGYRIDAGGRTVVFSGDDRASENLIRQSQNVDVLVHNMTPFTPEELAEPGRRGAGRRAALELLATPEQAGEVFTKAHPRLAVLYHHGRRPQDIARVRTTWSGPLESSEDLMQITIGEEIKVTRP